MTNYQLSKLINYRLEQEQLKPITSQQIYNARRGQKQLDGTEALEYVEKYVERRRNGSTTRSVNPAEFFASFEK